MFVILRLAPFVCSRFKVAIMGRICARWAEWRRLGAIWAKKAKIPEKVIATGTPADYHNGFGETTYAATRAIGA